jgi:hypothetical protein
MLKDWTSSAPAARSDAASRLLDALLVAGATPHGIPDRENLPALLFVIDLGAFSTLGKPITDLPWVHRFANWEASGDEFPDWVVRLRTRSTGHRPSTSPGTAFLSGMELELIGRAVDTWWSFDEPGRSAVWDCMRTLETPSEDLEVDTPSLWDTRRIRRDREESIRQRLATVSLDSAPRSTVDGDASEAIAAAVLDTILSGST